MLGTWFHAFTNLQLNHKPVHGLESHGFVELQHNKVMNSRIHKIVNGGRTVITIHNQQTNTFGNLWKYEFAELQIHKLMIYKQMGVWIHYSKMYRTSNSWMTKSLLDGTRPNVLTISSKATNRARLMTYRFTEVHIHRTTNSQIHNARIF